ncbi:MAG: efflux RND transporter periplasmic adaptor subunit [Betaproteobacteria bacterium]
MQQKKQKLIAAMIFISVLAIGFGITQRTADAQSKAQTPVPQFIRKGEQIQVPEGSSMRSQILVKAIEAQQLPHILAVPASVEADPARTVNVLPPVTGRVVELKINLGDYVKKGQALVVLASADFAQANTDLNKSRDALQLSKRAVERARGVFETGGSPLKDVEQAQSNNIQAREELQRAEARVKAIAGAANSNNKTHHLTLTAPASGFITTLSTAQGSFANDPNASLMTISNLERVWITASVPETAAGFVNNGQNVDVTLSAYLGETFSGTVSFVSAVLDPETRTNKVRISFDNPQGRFKPNMFAKVFFSIPQTRQIIVENSALLMNNDSVTVFVESEPWTFTRRSIELGNEEGKEVRVRKGLNPGERIIVKGGVLLND